VYNKIIRVICGTTSLTYVDFYFPLGLNFREFFLIVVGVGMFSFHVHRFYYNRKGFK